MKKSLIFAMAGLVLFAACSKNDTATPEPQPQKMTVTLGAPAMGTKTVLTPTGSGNIGFKQSWKEGDAVMFLYLHETLSGLQNEKFVCTKVNVDGSAEFTCDESNIATAVSSGKTSLNIVYPYSSEYDTGNYYTHFKNFDGTLEKLPDYCAFNAITNIKEDGTIDVVSSFNNDVVILRIPAGTLLVNGATGAEDISIGIGAIEKGKIGCHFVARANQVAAVTNNAGEYVYTLPASMTNGVLDKDVYAVWYHHSSWGPCQLNIDVVCNGGANHIYNLASYNFVMGNVYTLSQETLKAGHAGTVIDY